MGQGRRWTGWGRGEREEREDGRKKGREEEKKEEREGGREGEKEGEKKGEKQKGSPRAVMLSITCERKKKIKS